MHSVSGASSTAHTHDSAHPFDNMNMKTEIIPTHAILQLSEVSVIGTKSLK